MRKTKTLALMISVVMVGGCTHSSSVPPQTSQSQKKRIPFIGLDWSASQYAATFETHKETVSAMDSTQITEKDVMVDLWDSTDIGPVNGGTCMVNGNTITPYDYTADSEGYIYEMSLALGNTVPILFNGSNCIFSVAGSAKFAALTDTVPFPDGDMTVTAPAMGITVSKSSGFTVNWNYNSGSPNSVVIQVNGDTTGVKVYETTDNGSYSVPSSDLSSFITGGRIRVSVSRISYKDTTDALGRSYAMAAYTTQTIYHTLVP